MGLLRTGAAGPPRLGAAGRSAPPGSLPHLFRGRGSSGYAVPYRLGKKGLRELLSQLEEVPLRFCFSFPNRLWLNLSSSLFGMRKPSIGCPSPFSSREDRAKQFGFLVPWLLSGSHLFFRFSALVRLKAVQYGLVKGMGPGFRYRVNLALNPSFDLRQPKLRSLNFSSKWGFLVWCEH